MHCWLTSRVIALTLSGILCGIVTEASHSPPDHILPPNNNKNNNAQAGPVNAANIWSNPDPVEIAGELIDVYENYEPVPTKTAHLTVIKWKGSHYTCLLDDGLNGGHETHPLNVEPAVSMVHSIESRLPTIIPAPPKLHIKVVQTAPQETQVTILLKSRMKMVDLMFAVDVGNHLPLGFSKTVSTTQDFSQIFTLTPSRYHQIKGAALKKAVSVLDKNTYDKFYPKNNNNNNNNNNG